MDPEEQLQEAPTPVEELPPRRAPGDRSQVRGLIAAVIAVSLALNGLLAYRLRDQQDENARTSAQLADAKRGLTDLQGGIRSTPGDALAKLQAAVEQIRGLEFREPVTPEILTPAEFEKRIREDFVKGNPKARTLANQKVLATLGAIPESLDLYEFLQKLQAEQVAGYYDSKTKKLVVRASDIGSPSPLTRVFLAHELTHAVTDQHYDLSRLDKLQDASKDDEAEAFLSLAEGDAQLVMTIYAQQILTFDEQREFRTELASISQAVIEAAPKFIQDEIGFPYSDGQSFVSTLRERGGFDRVNKTYANPPTSSEQIIHPSRYLDSLDPPTSVPLPDITDALGTGWKQISTGGFGELDLRALADHGGGQGLSTQEARNAADGWDGGRYVAASSRAGTVVAVECAFDSPTEAREAVHSFGEWLPLRYGNVGNEMSIGEGTGSGWQGEKAAGEVLLSGSSMLLILGPDPDSVRNARRAFRGF